jgi:effector-binding domain-containing protein/uncharacterized protein YndB with AHSA1/START domain
MKFLIGLIVILLVVAGAALGAAHFLLPSTATASRSIDIERPPAAVFTLVNNMRAFNEWSPWAGRDPKAEYTYEGPAAGPGQKMTWKSAVQSVGNGSMTTTAATPYAKIEQAIGFEGQGEAGSTFDFVPVEGGTRVTWTFSYDAGAMPWNKIMGFFAQGAVGKDYEAGLANLKKVAEGLPKADFADLKTEFVTLAPKPMLYLEDNVSTEAAVVTASRNEAIALLKSQIAIKGVTPAGPPIVTIKPVDNTKAEMQVGLPYDGTLGAGSFGIKNGVTPEGQMVKVVHAGGADTLGQTYAKLEAFMAASKLAKRGPAFESLVDTDNADPAQRKIEIYQPVG